MDTLIWTAHQETFQINNITDIKLVLLAEKSTAVQVDTLPRSLIAGYLFCRPLEMIKEQLVNRMFSNTRALQGTVKLNFYSLQIVATALLKKFS